MQRPSIIEYAPAYQKYIDLVSEGDFLELLDKNTDELIAFFGTIDSSKHDYSYAEGKWTIKEALMHIIDTERGFSFRAFACVRMDDKTPLYGLDEELYAANVDVSDHSMEDLMEEFLAVRESFRFIFTSNQKANFHFLGNGIGHKISASAIGYIAIGHVLHHMNVVGERYLA